MASFLANRPQVQQMKQNQAKTTPLKTAGKAIMGPAKNLPNQQQKKVNFAPVALGKPKRSNIRDQGPAFGHNMPKGFGAITN